MFITEKNLKEFDPELWNSINNETARQEEHIELIASENYTSKSVLEVQGSVLTNKYAEGYPGGKRYYGGCEHVDVAESLTIERAKNFMVQLMQMFSHILEQVQTRLCTLHYAKQVTQ